MHAQAFVQPRIPRGTKPLEWIASRRFDAVVDFVSRSDDNRPFGVDSSLSADGNLLRTAIHLANMRVRDTAISSLD